MHSYDLELVWDIAAQFDKREILGFLKQNKCPFSVTAIAHAKTKELRQWFLENFQIQNFGLVFDEALHIQNFEALDFLLRLTETNQDVLCEAHSWFSKAAATGVVEFLDFMEKKYPRFIPSHLVDKNWNHISVLDWCLKRQMEFAPISVIQSTNLKKLKWYFNVGFPFDSKHFQIAVENFQLRMDSMFEEALKVVLWFREKKIEWGKETFDYVLRVGGPQLIRWAKVNGYVFDERHLSIALMNRNIAVAQVLQT